MRSLWQIQAQRTHGEKMIFANWDTIPRRMVSVKWNLAALRRFQRLFCLTLPVATRTLSPSIMKENYMSGVRTNIPNSALIVKTILWSSLQRSFSCRNIWTPPTKNPSYKFMPRLTTRLSWHLRNMCTSVTKVQTNFSLCLARLQVTTRSWSIRIRIMFLPPRTTYL